MPLDVIDIADQGRSDGPKGRPWLGVRFLCAGTYQRVYQDRDGRGYTARCNRCGKCVRFRVGAGGTDRRFFEVSC
jgi:hypothetical protein